MTDRAPLTPGRVSPRREVPAQIARPEYVGKKEPKRSARTVQTPQTVDLEREYRAVVEEVLEVGGADGRISAFVRSTTHPGSLADTAG